MKTHSSLESWLAVRNETLGRVGFVPTMGALHEGHLSLLKKARLENDTCILSIFINPTQFNNADDLKNYPKTLKTDLAMAESVGCDHILLPTQEMMYPDNYRFRVTENSFSKVLCGAHRPGHFDGVLTIVMKLLHLTQADRAYFGEKDFQQFELIRQMTKSFFMNVDVIGVPTVRESDGLAMSSRNLRLSESDRKKASLLSKTLGSSLDNSADAVKLELAKLGFAVDYVEDHVVGEPPQPRRFVAATLGTTRLIDNMLVNNAPSETT